MKYLIIYTHPNPASLNAQLKNAVVTHLSSNGHEVTVRDLYRLQFKPVLTLADMQGQRQGSVTKDVLREQQYIKWADCLIFIHPIWWTGLPAMAKGYIDRVFSYGFAYRYHKGVQSGLLREKEVAIINTQGKSNAIYKASGMEKALCLTSDTGIFRYCGFHIRHHFFLDQADRATEAEIEQWKQQIAKAF